MKGSTVDRQVLAKNPNANIKKSTLKDTDFDNLEGNIFVNSHMEKALKQILVLDVLFLERKKLIDYSLIVFKVNIIIFLFKFSKISLC